MDGNDNELTLTDAIKNGAKAAREIGKSRERTYAIGEGLLAMRSKCLIAMGKDTRINDRTILKSAKYRELMSKALKTYPDYTLSTVFKNDSTRLAYMFVAEYRSQVENAFAAEEIKNPGATLRIINPERMKAKFKSLTEPLKAKKAKAAQAAEAEAQEQDELFKKLREDAISSRRQYDDLFAKYIDFDDTPAEKLIELLLDTAAHNRKNRLRFIDLVVKYATADHADVQEVAAAMQKVIKPKRQRKAKADKPPIDPTTGRPANYRKEDGEWVTIAEA